MSAVEIQSCLSRERMRLEIRWQEGDEPKTIVHIAEVERVGRRVHGITVHAGVRVAALLTDAEYLPLSTASAATSPVSFDLRAPPPGWAEACDRRQGGFGADRGY